jgi:heat shock protein HslJ
MKLISFISAGALILASGFLMKKENATEQSLYGVKWSLKNIHTEAGIEEVQTKAFIKFDEAKRSAGGNGSCNSFGSTATVHNNEVVFTHIFSTKMYCEGVQKTEDSFLKQLGEVNRFEIKDKKLSLYQGDKILLEFISG